MQMKSPRPKDAAPVPSMLQAIAETLPDGIVVHDPMGGVRYANAAFLALVGADESIIGRPILELLHPDEHALLRERMRAVIETGTASAPRIFRYLRRDGTTVMAESRGVHLRDSDDDLILVSVRDLTEERRSRRALEESIALFRTLIDHLRIGVLVQGPNAEILVSNDAAHELLGLDVEQLLGKTSFDPDWNVIREDGTDFPGPLHPVPSAIRERRPIRDVVMGVYRPRRRDRVWLLVNAEPQLAPNGEVLQVVCTFSDITEQRRIQAQAASGDRLASLGRLAAGVAHEVNNPLAFAMCHLELLERTALNEEQRVHLERITDGARRVRSIVDDLRTLSRGDDEQRGPVDLRPVVEAAVAVVAPLLRHRAKLSTFIESVPMVMGNPSRFGQLVINLVMNAADAIEEGRAHENTVTLRLCARDEKHVRLEVEDTGPGIPPDVIGRIFDPFFTTKPMGAGAGLGLSICHGIVTSAGGTIDVESDGRGTVFRVELLAAPQTSPAPRPRTELSAVPSTILIIDDEVNLGLALALLLQPHHRVHVETRATVALERILGGEKFDVIFCDLAMPEMSGMDLFETLEKRDPAHARRTVFMTGGALTERAARFLHEHASSCLMKPFTFLEMDQAIGRVRASTADED